MNEILVIENSFIQKRSLSNITIRNNNNNNNNNNGIIIMWLCLFNIYDELKFIKRKKKENKNQVRSILISD
jgi:hypothetical protein